MKVRRVEKLNNRDSEMMSKTQHSKWIIFGGKNFLLSLISIEQEQKVNKAKKNLFANKIH